MGVLKPQWVIGLVSATDELKYLDRFVGQHPKLFAKSKQMVNGYVNYVMFWDGSKEGWDDSDIGDDLRKQFLILLSHIKYSEVYEIERQESCEPSLKYTPNW